MAAVCCRATADDGSLLQVRAAREEDEDLQMEEFWAPSLTSREWVKDSMQKLANKTGFDTKRMNSVLRDASTMMKQIGGPPRASAIPTGNGVLDEGLHEAENHPFVKFLSEKSNMDQIMHALHAPAQGLLDSLNRQHDGSVESTLHNFSKSKEPEVERFMRLADETARSVAASKSVPPDTEYDNPFYLKGHSYSLRFHIKGETGCADRIAFRWRLYNNVDALNMNPMTGRVAGPVYKWSGESLAGFYRSASDGIETYGGNSLYVEAYKVPFVGMCIPYTPAPVPQVAGCSQSITTWKLQLTWVVSLPAIKFKDAKGQPDGRGTQSRIQIKILWEDKSASGGQALAIDNVKFKWAYQNTWKWPTGGGDEKADTDFRITIQDTAWCWEYWQPWKTKKIGYSGSQVAERYKQLETSARGHGTGTSKLPMGDKRMALSR